VHSYFALNPKEEHSRAKRANYAGNAGENPCIKHFPHRRCSVTIAARTDDGFFSCVGARTAIRIDPVTLRWLGNRVGLHHLCLRARSREDVDRCAALLKEMNATIVRGPMEGSWAPGYYYVPHCHINGLRLPSSSLVPQSSGKGKGTLSVFWS
jgi:hypothetical protein